MNMDYFIGIMMMHHLGVAHCQTKPLEEHPILPTWLKPWNVWSTSSILEYGVGVKHVFFSSLFWTDDSKLRHLRGLETTRPYNFTSWEPDVKLGKFTSNVGVSHEKMSRVTGLVRENRRVGTSTERSSPSIFPSEDHGVFLFQCPPIQWAEDD